MSEPMSQREMDASKEALRRCMWQQGNTNNDVTRYIADAVAEYDLLRAEVARLRDENERLALCKHECKIDCLLAEYNKQSEENERLRAENEAAKKCIEDVWTYLELGSAKFIAKTIKEWRKERAEKGEPNV